MEENELSKDQPPVQNLNDLITSSVFATLPAVEEPVNDDGSPYFRNEDDDDDLPDKIQMWLQIFGPGLGTLTVDEIEPILSASPYFRRNDFYILNNALGDRDDRRGNSTLKMLKNNCKSVAVITDNSSFENLTEPSIRAMRLLKKPVRFLDPSSSQMQDYYIDKHFTYSWQYTLQNVYGTCFFISQKQVMMTWHSLSFIKSIKRNDDSKRFFIIQNYSMKKRKKLRKIEPQDIYEIIPDKAPQIVNQISDWVIIEVYPVNGDYKSENFISLAEPDSTGNFSCQLSSCGMDTYCIGHGMNLPAKISLHGMVYKKEPNNMFKAKLETFPGNSGSPVFDAQTHRIIGMVSGGDYLNVILPNRKIMPLAQLGGIYGATCTCVNAL